MDSRLIIPAPRFLEQCRDSMVWILGEVVNKRPRYQVLERTRYMGLGTVVIPISFDTKIPQSNVILDDKPPVAKSIVYGLLEVCISGRTGRDLAFQCAATCARDFSLPTSSQSAARSSFLEKKRSVIEVLVPRSGRSGVFVADPGLGEKSFLALSHFFTPSWVVGSLRIRVWVGVVGTLDWGEGIEK